MYIYALFRLSSLRVLVRLRCRHQMVWFYWFCCAHHSHSCKRIVHKYIGKKADIQHTEIVGYLKTNGHFHTESNSNRNSFSSYFYYFFWLGNLAQYRSIQIGAIVTKTPGIVFFGNIGILDLNCGG